MINKAILVGHVGKDPDVRNFENNQKVANFPLATSEPAFKTKDGREIPERTEWHNISVRRGLAEVVERYVKKGSQLYIEGKIHTRSYNKDESVRYITEIIPTTIKMLGKKTDTGNAAPPPQQNQEEFLSNTDQEDDFPF